MDRLSLPLARALGELLSERPMPYLVLGHSMGAAVAYEVCRELEHRGERLPAQLIVSACEAPARQRPGRLHLASDERLREELVRLGGTRGGLAEHPELGELILPAVRGDYALIETWRPSPARAPLPVPIAAWFGADDTELDAEDAGAWRSESSRAFAQRAFPGGHFYLVAEEDRVLEELVQTLARSMGIDWPSTP